MRIITDLLNNDQFGIAWEIKVKMCMFLNMCLISLLCQLLSLNSGKPFPNRQLNIQHHINNTQVLSIPELGLGLGTWRSYPFQGLRFETSYVLSIPELDHPIQSFASTLIGGPASEWWNRSLGLVGPWTWYWVYKRKHIVSHNQHLASKGLIRELL